MDTLFTFIEHAAGPFAATMVALTVVIYKLLPGLRKEAADTNGQIGAIEVYKELLAEEREARLEAEKRLDRFAEERNKAVLEIALLRGQVQSLSDIVTRQNEELQSMKDELIKVRMSVNRSTGGQNAGE